MELAANISDISDFNQLDALHNPVFVNVDCVLP